MSITNAATKKVKELFDNDAKNVRKFGPPGGMKKEQKKCDVIRTYMACRGYLSTEKKRVDLPPDSTLEDARNAFGRPMRQQKILDEQEYGIDDPLSTPLINYSRECNVSLIFAYSGKKEMEIASTATGEAISGTTKVLTATTQNATKIVGDAWRSRNESSKFPCITMGICILQMSSKLHYNPLNNPERDYEWPTRFYSKIDFDSDFESFGRIQINKQNCASLPKTEFFVRMTYEEEDGSESVWLEGFRPPVVCLKGKPSRNHHTTMIVKPGTSELAMRFSGVKSYSPEKAGFVALDNFRGLSLEDRWPLQSRKEFLNRVHITVLACRVDKGRPLSPTLVVSTHGYNRSQYNIGYMTPRPRSACIRNTAAISNSVCVGFFPYHGQFGISVNTNSF